MKKILFLFALQVILFTVKAQERRADRLFDRWDYAKASTIYQRKINRKPSADLYYQLGICYRKMSAHFKDEEAAFAKVEEYGPYSDPNFHLEYAKSLRTNGKINEALKSLDKFLKLKPEDSQGLLLKKSIERIEADRFTDQPIILKNLGKINSTASDFSPIRYKNQIIFTSSRKSDKHRKKYGWTGSYYLDLYQTDATESETKLENLRLFEVSKINHKFHDGSITFSKNYDTMFFSRVEKYLKGLNKESLRVERNKVFMREFKNGEWQKEIPFYLNSDYYSVANPYLSSDGNKIYFVSDMPGGYGSTDIYYCEKNDGGWGSPVNLGPGINTAYQENFPSLDENGNLYFSSDGHLGYGGMDLCVAKAAIHSFLPAKPLKAPMNSSYDDFGIMILQNEKTGYISSNRPLANRGSDDLYHFSLLDEKIDSTLKLSDYTIGWTPKLPELEVVKVEPEIKEEIVLERIDYNVFPYKPYELKIYYDFDRSFIRNQYFNQLDDLVDLMKKYPDSKISLSGHTDSHGKSDYNFGLSDRRNNSVIFFLTEQGIDKKRISAKGYGFTRLVNRCKKGVKCSDDEDQMNRRVEIQLLPTKSKPILKQP
jgi:tetratricopeptide (TPR) repeat protein